MKLTSTLLILTVVLLLANPIFSQRNCGTMDYLENQIQENPKLLDKIHSIEEHTQNYIQNNNFKAVNGIISIPVVVHVVYNTTAENISDEQIESQIVVLNEDFRRLNADASNTPLDFVGVAADIEIEFYLATLDPVGQPTNGITRTSTSVTTFNANDAMKFNTSGGIDAWPTGSYLNIWVCNLSGGLLGYAQFPGGAAATDGIVNDYAYFGTKGTATPPFHLGRTATHEVGHWLNLRHIWGDGGCSVDDFVSDTPLAGGPNTNSSPCTYPGPNSCNEGPGDLPDMFQNYMDYSDDACMNLFSTGQKSRMRALFDPGGFRESLLNAGQPPTCTDGIQNGNETGVDCGGPDCPVCPTCTDGIQNGDETGVDCGGSFCEPCPCPGDLVTLSITLDNYPEETSLDIRDEYDNVVASGGTYGNLPDGSTLTENICLDNGCYDFTMYDVYGDGICCAYGNGSYTLSDQDNNILASGDTFGSSETTNFCITGDPTGTIVINKVTDPVSSGIDFSFLSNHYLTINTPGSIAGQYDAGGAYFGAQLDISGISGELELVDNGAGNTFGCEALSGFTAGNIAVIDRGNCFFTDKVVNAESAGAIAVIIVNSTPGYSWMSAPGNYPIPINIPSIMISQEQGDLIKEELSLGNPVNATLSSNFGNFSLEHGESITYENIPTGTYLLQERSPYTFGYQLSDIQINDPSGGSNAHIESNLVEIGLSEDEIVEITFVNSEIPFPEYTVYGENGVTLGEKSKVEKDGTVGSNADVYANKDVKVKNNIEGGGNYIGEKKVKADNLIFNGNVNLEESHKVYGNVDGMNINLAKKVKVSNDVTASGTVTMHQNATVMGTVTPFGTPETYTPVLLRYGSIFTSGGDDIIKGNKKSTALDPGSYGELDLGEKNKLYLSSGNYYFDNIYAKKELKIYFDALDGDINVFVSGKIEIGKKFKGSITNGSIDQLFFETRENFTIGEEGKWYGTVFAPFGDIIIDKKMEMNGNFWAGGIVQTDKSVKVKYTDPNSNRSSTSDETESITPQTNPDEDILVQNFPNPFKGKTSINFTLTESNNTVIKVYNSMGKEIATLFDGMADEGSKYTVEFNGDNLPNGVYFYNLRSGNSVNIVRKMILMN